MKYDLLNQYSQLMEKSVCLLNEVYDVLVNDPELFITVCQKTMKESIH